MLASCWPTSRQAGNDLLWLVTLSHAPPPPSPAAAFFSEQLTAFELWLAHGSRDKKPPEQLPIVLQASGRTHRRAAQLSNPPAMGPVRLPGRC